MKSHIFTRAWNLYKEEYSVVFSECLKSAWLEYKHPKRFSHMGLPESTYQANLRAIKESGYLIEY